MVHRLAAIGAVIDHHTEALAQPFLLGHLLCHPHQVPQQRLVLLGRLGQLQQAKQGTWFGQEDRGRGGLCGLRVSCGANGRGRVWGPCAQGTWSVGMRACAIGSKVLSKDEVAPAGHSREAWPPLLRPAHTSPPAKPNEDHLYAHESHIRSRHRSLQRGHRNGDRAPGGDSQIWGWVSKCDVHALRDWSSLGFVGHVYVDSLAWES